MIAANKKTALTLADDVENLLLDYMRRNHLSAGDSLPKEEELVERLQVSRHIVREGLSRLKALGLIESRRRRGMVMQHPGLFMGLKKLAKAELIPDSGLRDLLEMRVTIELGMCVYIYQRKTPVQIDRLRRFAGLPEQYTQPKELEIAFHTELVKIAGNAAVNQFSDILAVVFEPIISHRKLEGRTSTHQDICDTLESGSLADFRRTMEIHLAPYTEKPLII
ncbi:MAG: FadR family transcriptional regulator [Oligosphaeraceae bacterium]|nr:FadR family transcriptional regulator [Oligosphaeraceae bacterium]